MEPLSVLHNSIFRMYGVKSQEPTPFPTYMRILPFERSFSLVEWKAWFHSNWSLAIYFSLIYILAVFSIQFSMKHVKAFSLRRPLLFWNLFLAGFSIVGTIRTVPELLYIFQTKSPWYTSICTRYIFNLHMSKL